MRRVCTHAYTRDDRRTAERGLRLYYTFTVYEYMNVEQKKKRLKFK